MFDPRVLKGMVRASALVFELGVLVVVGALAGSWLDEQLGTSPLLLMLLSLTALVGGMIRVHRTLQRLDAENEHNPPHS
jgi:F0F1-type ATP synthase assembly protein I